MLHRLRVGALPRIDAFDLQQSAPCCKIALLSQTSFPPSKKQALQTFTCLTKIGCKHEVGAFTRLIAPNSHSAACSPLLFIHCSNRATTHLSYVCRSSPLDLSWEGVRCRESKLWSLRPTLLCARRAVSCSTWTKPPPSVVTTCRYGTLEC